MITKEELTIEFVLSLLPKTTSLVYVNYDDVIPDDVIQKCFDKGSLDYLYEKVDDWYWESASNSNSSYIGELFDKLYDMTDGEQENSLTWIDIDNFIQENMDIIQDEIYNRCDDNTVRDLMNNTRGIICHYDTGYYMDSNSWSWSDAQVRLERYLIKKHLGLLNTSQYDEMIEELINNATYGGGLKIYFELDCNMLFNLEKAKSIKFNNFNLGIVDHYNGSGHVVEGIDAQIVLPFDKDNLFLEKSIEYNWTYCIAGMCRDWCSNVETSLSEEELDATIEKSNTKQFILDEAELDAVFKSGSCTAGDKKLRRHRRLVYVNAGTCGTECLDCKTFWID